MCESVYQSKAGNMFSMLFVRAGRACRKTLFLTVIIMIEWPVKATRFAAAAATIRMRRTIGHRAMRAVERIWLQVKYTF